MKKIKKTDWAIILAIVLVFVVIIIANLRLIIISMKSQTEQAGQTQISSIKTDFENHIANAENSLIRVAGGAEQLMYEDGDRAKLEEYIITQKQNQLEESDGSNFNVYIAGQGWEIIPDFDAPEDYHATERNWYIGAIDSAGEIYITDPYIDRMTGGMCYTMSVMLSDGETVVGMDFNLYEIQQSIEKMSLSEGSVAMITTAEGLIVGYSDMSYVEKDIKKSLTSYSSLLDTIVEGSTDGSFTSMVDGKQNTVFYSMTNNNWYMILCVNNSDLYKSTIKQVVVNILINLMMLILIVVLYIFTVRSRIKTEEAQEGRELFVENLMQKLREPIKKITDISDTDSTVNMGSKENYADIKTSVLRMNDIMNDMNSYSSIVSDIENSRKEKHKEYKDISRFIRIIRNTIILLIIVLVISSYSFYESGSVSTNDMMVSQSNYYYYELKEWEKEQLTILSMFSDAVSADSEMLDDYQETVEWLDNIAKKYPGISVCYLANPYYAHTVIMNNGWQPEDDWKVEERDWYKSTEKSSEGYSISAPYIDAQTGDYCITMSEMVYGKNNEFLGIFGIDFYMDKLVKIFGESASDTEYVFLVDTNGDIINHPSAQYQMSENVKVNIRDTAYYEGYEKEKKTFSFIDYDGARRIGYVRKDEESGFSIVLVWNWKEYYALPILYTSVFSVFTLVVILLIIVLINKVINSQTVMNQKLTKAVNDAESAGNAKSEFLAQMSHEIRTPINAVIGMDEMILRESEDPSIREYAMDIKSASKTLLALINGILDFSKLESGKMEIVPVVYETTDLIDSLVKMISDRAEKKNLALELDIDERLPRIMYGDDVRLRQVITNLLTNAVKYTEEGSVTLVMYAETLNDKECTLFVGVKDTGIGIKEEDMEKMFQSFQRLEERRNRSIEGTGLGMSIVDGILKLMGSSLEVHSEYGRGSSFSFRIVQNVVNGMPIGEYDRHHRIEENSGNQKNLKITGADILVVDDNSMNLKVARGLMKRLGVIPDLANSGRKAIEMIGSKHYDIVLMDHLMPEMDGIETLKEIMSSSLVDDSTNIIALTANAITGAKEMYVSEGFKDYLSKPIDPEQLENMLVKYLPEGSYTYVDSVIESQTAMKDTPSAETSSNEGENTDMNDDPIYIAEGIRKDSSEGKVLEKLLSAGFNIKKALSYSMNDYDFYMELLQSYVETADEKQGLIRSNYEEKNWEEYRTQVHALKSSSKTIGAMELSDMALEQENASKALDEKTIDEGYVPLMEEYDKVVKSIRAVIDISDTSGSSQEDDSDDMEIMEFFPE